MLISLHAVTFYVNYHLCKCHSFKFFFINVDASSDISQYYDNRMSIQLVVFGLIEERWRNYYEKYRNGYISPSIHVVHMRTQCIRISQKSTAVISDHSLHSGVMATIYLLRHKNESVLRKISYYFPPVNLWCYGCYINIYAAWRISLQGKIYVIFCK